MYRGASWVQPAPEMVQDVLLRAFSDSGRLQAPMPGKVTVVHVKPGDKVKRGQVLMAMEAMKMEHAVAAPRDGVVKELRFQPGEQVGEGEALIVFEEDDA